MTPEGGGGDDEPLLVEPNSLLGQFLRPLHPLLQPAVIRGNAFMFIDNVEVVYLWEVILCPLQLFMRISILNIALNFYWTFCGVTSYIQGTCRLVTEVDGYCRPSLTIARGIDKDYMFGKLSDEEDEDGVDDLDDENLKEGGVLLERQSSGIAAGISGRDPTGRVFG